MTANVTPLRPADDADHVLEAAKGNYEEVLILGYSREGGVRSKINNQH